MSSSTTSGFSATPHQEDSLPMADSQHTRCGRRWRTALQPLHEHRMVVNTQNIPTGRRFVLARIGGLHAEPVQRGFLRRWRTTCRLCHVQAGSFVRLIANPSAVRTASKSSGCQWRWLGLHTATRLQLAAGLQHKLAVRATLPPMMEDSRCRLRHLHHPNVGSTWFAFDFYGRS